MFKVEGCDWSCVEECEVKTECDMDMCDDAHVNGWHWSCVDDWEVEIECDMGVCDDDEHSKGCD